MIQEKIAEAEFFLNKLIDECKKPENDYKSLFAISCYYSAFLGSSYSIFDYTLHHANRVFRLNLKDEEHWDYKTFMKKAKGKNNKKAIEYGVWWNTRRRQINLTKIGQVFARCRRINTHKRKAYKINFDPQISSKRIDGDYPLAFSIELKAQIKLKVEGFEQIQIQTACARYFTKIKKFRKEHDMIIEKIK